mgnify:CR=1 FL=1
MTTAIFIQARLKSSRMPYKVFHKINQTSVLERTIGECRKVQNAETALLVPHNEKGDFYRFLNRPKDLGIIGGSESNVLSRFWKGANQLSAKTIVRITADCPLITRNLIENAIQFYNENNFDYISNFALKNATTEKDKNNHSSETLLSDGFSVEVFSFSALKEAYMNAKSQYDLEHTTTWMKNNLNCGLYFGDFHYIQGKFSLDEQRDIKNIELYLRLWEKGFIQVRSKKEILLSLNQASKD